MTIRYFLPVLATGFAAVPWTVALPAGEAPPNADAISRRPIALLLVKDGKQLLVANRDSGTIAIVDTQSLRLLTESLFGRRLSAMTAVGAERVLLTDEESGELILLHNPSGEWKELRRLRAGPSAVGVCATDDGAFAAVACLWPRRLAIFDLAAATKASVAPVAVLDLPFAPRHLLPMPKSTRILVADSFGGELAVVDLANRRIESVRGLLAHNIRGLALDRQKKGVLLTHQVLYGLGRTVAGDIRSGNVLTNVARRIPLETLLDSRADLRKDDSIALLGDVDQGAGDPAGIAETDDGWLLVALAGVNELAIGRPEQALWIRLAVGVRPTALVVDPIRRRAYVANTFGDSISVVDLKARKIIGEVRLVQGGKTGAALRPAERGEMLFHNARLSLEGWYSCHSCHTDGHSNGRLNDNFTDGSFGTPKRVLSLLGTKDTGPWAWHGQMADLESQIRLSVKSTMQGAPASDEQVADLAAFLRTLRPAPSLLEARGNADIQAVNRGHKVFAREKCGTCHAPPTYTSPKTYDVGVYDELGGRTFNPPSLRGVSQGGPYFHDGRAATLEEVFRRFGHPLDARYSEQDVRDLVHFLRSL